MKKPHLKGAATMSVSETRGQIPSFRPRRLEALAMTRGSLLLANAAAF